MSGNENSLEIIISKLIQETYDLLSETIEAIKESDERAKKHGADWTGRHRLCVILETTEETQKGLPDFVVAPWFIAELVTTRDVVKHWKGKPHWEEIEPSLKNPNDFKHTILTLHVAEHLERGGHKAEIVPTGESPTPDLMVHAIGGTKEPVYVECYQPEVLWGDTSDISIEEADNIVDTAMDKAKKQLYEERPGILALCGYNQSKKNLNILRQTIQERLQKTSRPNLCGMWLITLGVRVRENEGIKSFNSTLSADFISNPSYSGGVIIDSKVPQNHPQLIKEPLKEIKTDDLKF